VVEYEEILLRNNKTGPGVSMDTCSGKDRLKLMTQIIQSSLEKTARGKKMEAAADATLQLIDFAQELVGGMLQGYPPAAIAWSGFCTLTPVSQMQPNLVKVVESQVTQKTIPSETRQGEPEDARGT
jgi:hypothetical protein